MNQTNKRSVYFKAAWSDVLAVIVSNNFPHKPIISESYNLSSIYIRRIGYVSVLQVFNKNKSNFLYAYKIIKDIQLSKKKNYCSFYHASSLAMHSSIGINGGLIFSKGAIQYQEFFTRYDELLSGEKLSLEHNLNLTLNIH